CPARASAVARTSSPVASARRSSSTLSSSAGTVARDSAARRATARSAAVGSSIRISPRAPAPPGLVASLLKQVLRVGTGPLVDELLRLEADEIGPELL